MADDKKTTAMTTKGQNALVSPMTPIFQRFRPEDYNVLAPITHMASLPAGTRLAITEVRVGRNSDDVFKISGGKKLLGKTILDKIAQAAGISWTSERRVDDRGHPHYVETEVVGKITDFDGSVREITGAHSIDLRMDAGHGIRGGDFDDIVSKAESAKPPRDPSRQLGEARKFIFKVCISKAKNRAISSTIGLKRSHTDQELDRPFVIVKLAPDTSDPEARKLVHANMAGAAIAMFGPGPVVDAEFEEATPAQLPAAGGGEESAGTPPPAGSEPAHDPETGETFDDLPPMPAKAKNGKERLKIAWDKADAKGLSPEGWTELVHSAAEGRDYVDLTPEDMNAIELAVYRFCQEDDQ